jgi:uncharacterized membrane protein
MNLRKLPEVFERATVLDRPAAVLDNALGTILEETGPKGGKVERALHGAWLGHPLHAAVTDLPVGALTAAVALDLLDAVRRDQALAPGVDTLIGVGLLGGVAAAVTGATDWHAARDRRVKRTGVVHAAFNTTAMLLFGASLFERRRKARGVGRALGIAGLVALTAGAYLGGHLTYRQGVGVDQ